MQSKAPQYERVTVQTASDSRRVAEVLAHTHCKCPRSAPTIRPGL